MVDVVDDDDDDDDAFSFSMLLTTSLPFGAFYCHHNKTTSHGDLFFFWEIDKGGTNSEEIWNNGGIISGDLEE